MRFAHRPACRGQRVALTTAPTFDHKLHRLLPLSVSLNLGHKIYRGDNHCGAGGSGTYHSFDFAKYGYRYLSEIQYRFNCRFQSHYHRASPIARRSHYRKAHGNLAPAG